MLKEIKTGREVIRFLFFFLKKDSIENDQADLKKNQIETLEIKEEVDLIQGVQDLNRWSEQYTADNQRLGILTQGNNLKFRTDKEINTGKRG